MANEILLTDAADQEITAVFNDTRCTLRFRYNTTSDRWSFDLRKGEPLVVVGRRIEIGVDLIKPFRLGLGSLFAVDWERKDAEPNRLAFAERRVRLYQSDDGSVLE